MAMGRSVWVPAITMSPLGTGTSDLLGTESTAKSPPPDDDASTGGSEDVVSGCELFDRLEEFCRIVVLDVAIPFLDSIVAAARAWCFCSNR